MTKISTLAVPAASGLSDQASENLYLSGIGRFQMLGEGFKTSCHACTLASPSSREGELKQGYIKAPFESHSRDCSEPVRFARTRAERKGPAEGM
jgi:hypothetical protein